MRRQRAATDGNAGFLKEEVDDEDVAEVVANWTGIPVSKLMEGELEKLVQMESRLHERVVGQDEAVAAVSNALPLAGGSAGPQPPDRHLLHRPDGRGQDRAGAGAGRVHVRLGAGDGADRHVGVHGEALGFYWALRRGYVGYEEGGQLTEAVRRRPYSVVLLDEIEKAAPDVFNVLLQLMDDGRLTDGQGRTVHFENTVVIMTSNVPGGLDGVRATFKPEFVNRLDEIVEFEPLSRDEIGRIVDLQVARLVQRVRERGVENLAERGRPHAAGKPRLRPRLRRATAQAGDSEAARGQACAGSSWRASSGRATS